jgi:hypothetical protein
VCDNTTNNDTLLESLEERCNEEGIDFSHTKAWIRCLPHIIHLAAMQLLEGIGAIKSGAGCHGVYQESVTAPVDCDHDDNFAALLNDTDDEDHFETLQEVLSAIDKVCHTAHKNPAAH